MANTVFSELASMIVVPQIAIARLVLLRAPSPICRLNCHSTSPVFASSASKASPGLRMYITPL